MRREMPFPDVFPIRTRRRILPRQDAGIQMLLPRLAVGLLLATGDDESVEHRRFVRAGSCHDVETVFRARRFVR